MQPNITIYMIMFILCVNPFILSIFLFCAMLSIYYSPTCNQSKLIISLCLYLLAQFIILNLCYHMFVFVLLIILYTFAFYFYTCTSILPIINQWGDLLSLLFKNHFIFYQRILPILQIQLNSF
jgi:hypothetical protein